MDDGRDRDGGHGSEHLHDPMTGQHLAFLETGRDTGGRRLRVRVRLDRGGRVPMHLHLRQHETVTVEDGELDLRLGRALRRLHPGDRAVVPPRRLHRMGNAADGESRFLLDVEPARRTETLMRAMFRAANLAARLSPRRPR